jgi:negative regulator of flagellin synthesis FlgM
MVDSVKSAISTVNIQKSRLSVKDGGEKLSSVSQTPGAKTSDSVELTSAEMSSVAKDLASAAPVDFDKVNRIKDAIENGKYPIDIDRVSEALMDAYRELKS